MWIRNLLTEKTLRTILPHVMLNLKPKPIDMKKILIIVLTGIICYGCHEKTELNLKKEVLEYVLKDRFKLNSTVRIIKESNDSIGIFNLTLIENSFNDFFIDTKKKSILIFSYNTPSFSHPFFSDSIDFIIKQIQSLESSLWDTTSLNLDIKIDSPLKEYDDTLNDRTDLWIQNNINNKAFLQISEPVYNLKGEVLVASRITVDGYVIDKSYILKKENDNWVAVGHSTLIGKFSSPEFEEITNPDGIKVTVEKRYLIVLGYYDI